MTALPVLLALFFFLFLTVLHPVVGQAMGHFTRVTAQASFSQRSAAFTFSWSGAIWMAGGLTKTSPGCTEVWGSYDFGRTWAQPMANGSPVLLPGLCSSQNSRGLVYNNAVYLVCGLYASTMYPHGTSVTSSNNWWTFVNSDPGLTSAWTTYKDGCLGCYNFNVERMAVPFDGIGTLVLVNSGVDNKLYWQSATGAFRTGVALNQWTAFVPAAGGSYTLPWSARQYTSTTTDAEGLVLIQVGGSPKTGTGTLQDVWQLSWMSSDLAPLSYQVSSSPAYGSRLSVALYTVNDWLFLVGGFQPPSSSVDDAWMSADYGATWPSYASSSATGTRRDSMHVVSVGRRFFVIGGRSSVNNINTPQNDVYVSYW